MYINKNIYNIYIHIASTNLVFQPRSMDLDLREIGRAAQSRCRFLLGYPWLGSSSEVNGMYPLVNVYKKRTEKSRTAHYAMKMGKSTVFFGVIFNSELLVYQRVYIYMRQ